MAVKLNGFEIPSARRSSLILDKETGARMLKLFVDRRNGKDAWSIYNDIKKIAGPAFDKTVKVSPYDGYALVKFETLNALLSFGKTAMEG
jgi:hypothetical protein